MFGMRHLRHSAWFGPRALVFAVMGAALAAPVAPVPLPDPAIPGFHFPESEATLTRWITEMTRATDPGIAAVAFEKIHLHGWGLWTALTAETAQFHNGERLRVFETWPGTDDLLEGETTSSIADATAPERSTRNSTLRKLGPLRVRDAEREHDTPAASTTDAAANRVMGLVKYDPTAADHIVRQQLLRIEALDALLEGGASQIPPFPATALAVKPLFQIIRLQELPQGRYYALKAWPGPPTAPRPWAPAHWPGSVWIDVAGGGRGRGAVDELALADGSTRTEETTYPLSSFLHCRLSALDAAALNEGKPSPIANAGDIAILVAMHVSGRELARWTWQTFWWTPSPDAPFAPSSAAIAALRPEQLRGAARNYAMSLAYTMLSPDQPYVGGSNSTAAVYAYNPWLEARLTPADLPGSLPGLGPDGRAAANNVGVQTNCMSCHAQANYNPRQRTTAPQLTGARYVDLGAAEFVGTLQVDFLWSLARRAR
jgi:hypothetical protein